MKKKIIFLIVTLLAIFSLVACGNRKTEATGYNITHKDYVGVANIRVANGVVDYLTIDEVYLPNTWAKIVKGTGEVPTDIVSDETNWYGKYLVIGDKRFTGTLRDAPLVINNITYANQMVKYSAEGVDDLFTWLKNSEENCDWYVKQLLSNKAFVAKADWTKTEYQSAGKGGWTKATTGYWPAEDDRLGWTGNMAKIVAAVKGTKVDATNEKIVKNTNGYWEINGVNTGATAASFLDYYELARKAYNKANTAK